MIQRHMLSAKFPTDYKQFDYFNDYDDTTKWLNEMASMVASPREKQRILSTVAKLKAFFDAFLAERNKPFASGVVVKEEPKPKLIQTKNEAWGFYGTTQKNYGLADREIDEVYDYVARKISQKAVVTFDVAREFLDSKIGRMLSDDLSFYGAKPKSDKEAVLLAFGKWIANKKGMVKSLRSDIAGIIEET